MTPAARVAAAIEILDRILTGSAAEQALIAWARGSRFAGSGDRAAIRDLVFDALRRRRSCAAMGGGLSGRGLMLGAVRGSGQDLAAIFSGAAYAPEGLSAEEQSGASRWPTEDALAGNVALDCPDWLEAPLRSSLGEGFAATMRAMRNRAPVFLRANLQRIGRDEACELLRSEGLDAVIVANSATAIEVTGKSQRLKNAASYLGGLVELQDLSPQMAVERLPLRQGQRVLDFCAGGGGKTLAMAGLVRASFTAHDAYPERMRDLSTRAARAGIRVSQVRSGELATQPGFDLVVADVPCSGSGTWRRTPDGKWRLTPEKLSALLALQAEILDAAGRCVGPVGALAYMTCSLLHDENEAQVQAFLDRNAGWRQSDEKRYDLGAGGDGFFYALLTRV